MGEHSYSQEVELLQDFSEALRYHQLLLRELFSSSLRYIQLHLQKEELCEGGWFTRDKMPEIPDKASIARRLIDDWAGVV